ncbi:MAG TPA: hypothetical protein G4N98_08765 [Thermoflexia bacterium]|nr:hypothetical protein [Thermoflexia bacterium]
MKNAAEYLGRIKALIVLNNQVLRWEVVREEQQGNIGLFRCRLRLLDGSLLEMFEYFHIEAEEVQVTKYSFHWYDADGTLRKRWDNAAHHPEISTFPHHVHVGADARVLPHEPISAEKVLASVAEELL